MIFSVCSRHIFD